LDILRAATEPARAPLIDELTANLVLPAIPAPSAKNESVAPLITVFEKSPDAIPRTPFTDSFKIGILSQPIPKFLLIDPRSFNYVVLSDDNELLFDPISLARFTITPIYYRLFCSI
jgi:hypothetical protein